MNQVNIIGNIGQEPEVRSFASGKKVMRFSIAINGYSKDGSKRPTTWIPCETWDDTVVRFLKCAEKGKLSGRKIQVTGTLAVSEYPRQIGNVEFMQRKLYVKVHHFALLSKLSDEQEPAAAEPAQEPLLSESILDAADEASEYASDAGESKKSKRSRVA